MIQNNHNTIKPFQLLAKLDSFNNIEPKNNKIYKELQIRISGYEGTVKQSFIHFQTKLQHVQQELKELILFQKEEQTFAIIKLDAFQSSLKKTLSQYSEQSKIAQRMIQQMTLKFKQQFQRQILIKDQQNRQILDQYSLLNERLESIIASIKKKHSQMLKKYESLQKQVEQKMAILIERINISSQQLILNQDKFLTQISGIEERIQRELHNIDTQKQRKRFVIHQAINRLIQDVTLYEDDQR